MAAYNRVTQQFVDGYSLTAADFNAALADIKARIAVSAITAAPPVSASLPLTFSDTSQLLFSDGSSLTFSG